MKAIVQSEYGSADVLEFKEIAAPDKLTGRRPGCQRLDRHLPPACPAR